MLISELRTILKPLDGRMVVVVQHGLHGSTGVSYVGEDVDYDGVCFRLYANVPLSKMLSGDNPLGHITSKGITLERFTKRHQQEQARRLAMVKKAGKGRRTKHKIPKREYREAKR